jgi:hypothetical protein
MTYEKWISVTTADTTMHPSFGPIREALVSYHLLSLAVLYLVFCLAAFSQELKPGSVNRNRTPAAG